MKAINTEYHGCLFRSRLEARWAVFFDACGVDWEYEPEGYELSDGQRYLPDFLLHGVAGRSPKDLYVEVKGRMTKNDAEKILAFCGHKETETRRTRGGHTITYTDFVVNNPVLVVSDIPKCGSIREVTEYCGDWIRDEIRPYSFNFETIDGDCFAAHPGIDRNGRFALFGDDDNYLKYRDDEATLAAYKVAKQARFEHGDMPTIHSLACHKAEFTWTW